MKIGIKRVAANTHDIYTRWGFMDPMKTIKELLGFPLEGNSDDEHRINKELRPEVYQYLIPATKGNKTYTLDITINENEIDLPARMNGKSEWCKHMLVVIREKQSKEDLK